jgi:hypothetical protein
MKAWEEPRETGCVLQILLIIFIVLFACTFRTTSRVQQIVKIENNLYKISTEGIVGKEPTILWVDFASNKHDKDSILHQRYKEAEKFNKEFIEIQKRYKKWKPQ